MDRFLQAVWVLIYRVVDSFQKHGTLMLSTVGAGSTTEYQLRSDVNKTLIQVLVFFSPTHIISN